MDEYLNAYEEYISSAKSATSSAAANTQTTADYYREQGEAQLKASEKTFEELETDLESRHTRGLISDEKYYTQKDILLRKYNKRIGIY